MDPIGMEHNNKKQQQQQQILAEMGQKWDGKGPHGFRVDFRCSISWRGNFFNCNGRHVGKLPRRKQKKLCGKHAAKKNNNMTWSLFLISFWYPWISSWSGWSANLSQTHQRKTQSVAPAILLIHCQLLAVSSVLTSVAWTMGVKSKATFSPKKQTFWMFMDFSIF